MAEIFAHYGLTPGHYVPLIAGLRANPVAWRDFMMRFELGLEQPQPQRARWSASTIAGAYVVGGLIPLAPYLLSHTVARALPWSIAVTLAALAVFGYIKGRFTGTNTVGRRCGRGRCVCPGAAAGVVASSFGNSSTSACQATTGPLMPTPKLILGDVPSFRGQQVLRRPLKNVASKRKFAAGQQTFTGVRRGAAASWAAQ